MMGPLSTQLAALEVVDPSMLSGPELAAHVGELEQLRSRLAAVTIDAVGTLEEAGAHEVDGCRTAAVWLTAQCGTSKGDARGQVRLAVHLRSMPATRRAFMAGEITEAHARVLARGVANQRTAATFAWDESRLVGMARTMSADQLAQEMRRWIDFHDPDGTAPDDPADDVLHANQVGERVKIDGDLGLEIGTPLLAALRERVDVLYERDKSVAEANPDDALRVRTNGNRRAEALWELVMAGSGDASNPRRREPLYQVFIDHLSLATMRQRHDAFISLVDGTTVGIRLAHLWACDALVNRVVLDAHGAIVDLGRAERYASREQRRALAARDQGCAVPGCDRPPEQCDAHHVVFWDDLGPTDLDNLALLCRWHHRQVHRGRLSVETIRGRPCFSDASGRPIREGRHRPSADAA